MKQLKKLTRKQKIIVAKYLKNNQLGEDVNNYGLVSNDKHSFTVSLKRDNTVLYTIEY